MTELIKKLLEEAEFKELELVRDFEESVRQYQEQNRIDGEVLEYTTISDNVKAPIEGNGETIRTYFETTTLLQLREHAIITHVPLKVHVALSGKHKGPTWSEAVVTFILPSLKSVTYRSKRVTMIVAEREEPW